MFKASPLLKSLPVLFMSLAVSLPWVSNLSAANTDFSRQPVLGLSPAPQTEPGDDVKRVIREAYREDGARTKRRVAATSNAAPVENGIDDACPKAPDVTKVRVVSGRAGASAQPIELQMRFGDFKQVSQIRSVSAVPASSCGVRGALVYLESGVKRSVN